MTVKIAVATHKKLNFNLTEYYVPVQVNAKQNGEWIGYVHDSDGSNISEKNSSYCELTVLYWLWKNSDANIKGLCHYRRFFSNNPLLTISELDICADNSISDHILSDKQIENCLLEYDAIVAKPYRPYPDNEYTDLRRWCYESDIVTLRKVLSHKYPAYIEVFDKVMESTNISHFNMIIAKSTLFDQYANWLFDLLSEYEKSSNIQNYDTQHKRLYGYVAEALLNVYLQKNEINVKYAKIVSPSSYINYPSGRLKLLSIRKRVEQVFMFTKTYRLIEGIYKLLKPEEFAKYAACSEAMKKGTR